MPIYTGDRITFEATFRDSDGGLYNPDSIVLNIYDPANGLDCCFTDGDMTHPSTGLYQMQYDIPENGLPGSWRVVWVGTLSGGNKSEKMAFTVVKL